MITVSQCLCFTLAILFVTPADTHIPISNRTGWINAREFGATGSTFTTRAKVRAGSKQIEVTDVGDFKVGQQVILTRSYSHYEKRLIWGPNFARRSPLGNLLEIRGYDGSSCSWLVFLIEVAPGHPDTFRWTDDIGRTWHENQPITDKDGWVPLSNGVEVKFNRREFDGAYLISFSARDTLITSIKAIKGKIITLQDTPNRNADNAVLRHCDSAALQAAIDAALKQHKHLYIPSGHYNLAEGLRVHSPEGLIIEGQNAVDTIIDISNAEGACFSIRDGTDFTLRHFTMIGHSGFANRDQCGALRTRGVRSMWGCT